MRVISGAAALCDQRCSGAAALRTQTKRTITRNPNRHHYLGARSGSPNHTKLIHHMLTLMLNFTKTPCKGVMSKEKAKHLLVSSPDPILLRGETVW